MVDTSEVSAKLCLCTVNSTAIFCRCLRQIFFVLFVGLCKTGGEMKSAVFIALFVFFSMPASYAQKPAAPPIRLRSTLGQITTSSNTAFPCATASNCSRRFMRPRMPRGPIRSSWCGRLIRYLPMAPTITATTLGRRAFEKEGFIFVYQDVRGRYVSEGEFIDEAPHKAHLNGPKDNDPSTDTYDTIDWLIKNVPNNNGRVGHVGRFLSGILFCLRIDQLPPGAQSGFSASAHGRRWQRRRCLS